MKWSTNLTLILRDIIKTMTGWLDNAASFCGFTVYNSLALPL